ncbi:hypothetical protein NEUTE1DRAFT_45899 [Neurospora tetrasperma FGSC 2508]|uniref:Uncharacterized protein n=1 Tax=Neurospora tetrasperma (strain FGSC 2508 / ATCC MYA-4615 / P0657) TaxID=510951 RepID=F8MQV2_NEUT8|nr:uncharacterized protein NEUTE1DRAFT_45899 [Neurospora tetrasperma FGSC 2508]EGO56732.1 hypothetical protein NEUTE1DRAFT_45899 [Neurospora tetrasperma FGSC 2508]EGZ70391.1 hypothetical protein NEUTE2DRAFT_167820 [Neurospora tetrasperma FGSC 2509]
MANIKAQSSYHSHPPKKRSRIDSDLEDSHSFKDSDSANTQEDEEEEEEDDDDDDGGEEAHASPSLSSSTHQKSPSTSRHHYHRLLVTSSGPNYNPMIALCDQTAILALAAARDPSTIGKLLQQKYDAAWARLRRNSRIINFDNYYQRVEGLLSSLPRDLDPSESTRTHMRQACTTIDRIFDSIHQQVDNESKLESKISAARTMQRILRRLLIYSVNSGNIIPEEFSGNGHLGRLGLDGKMFMLIDGKFDHKKHEIKRMTAREDAWGGSDWVERVKELVSLSSRGGEVFKTLARVLEVVEKDAYNPATDYDSYGRPTF